MSPDEIKHFLVIHDTNARHTKVRSFGTDYDAAQEAYAQIEQKTLDRPNIDRDHSRLRHCHEAHVGALTIGA
jgi:hypothetical protein